MRLDVGAILKRFHHLEAALVRSAAAWIPAMHAIECKSLLARFAWETALTGDAIRERVFEVRFPSRLMDVGEDEPLVAVYRGSVDAPSAAAFLTGLAEVFLPASIAAITEYLDASDGLADAPSRRFLALALDEKRRAVTQLQAALRTEDRSQVDGEWVAAMAELLASVGGVGLHAPSAGDRPAVVPPSVEYAIPVDPARDARYFQCSFYWPDAVDPTYGYGTGLRLQLRSAVSHLNEVWAVEVAGAALFELSDLLGWEFMLDAARWTYDESRHMLMGQRRLTAWGLDPALIPLGRYIYDASAAGGDPVYRLGMLGLFETKNIGKKKTRARAFGAMGDSLSQRDMQFDWADETIHAEYGRRWLKKLLEVRGRPADDYTSILEECEALVEQTKDRTGTAELTAIRECADRLVAEAERLAASPSG